MAIEYDLEMVTALSPQQLASELLDAAEPMRLFETSVSSEQLAGDGAATTLSTWIQTYAAAPQPWAPIVTDLGITPTVAIGFRLGKNDELTEQRDDMVRLTAAVLERVVGDAVLSGMDVIWLVRQDGDLSVNERDDLWSPRRLAELRQPYRRATRTYADE
ncbi:SitI3 family protein [Amycolatopsis sp. H20-H5]|uniref:SitI3 family protein n=1 Tax=Amycolatopsis sp. H20-H5 TaxID=3046309 RepID=UPI002DB7FD3D|nr:SitI3 family protein [Amycolatopsis sp. H20-H5]MEC3974308.1 SitI3 family protein [Amycolatopsis sp. H20-H5]